MREDEDILEQGDLDDLMGSLNSLEKDYNIMDENTISEDDFDRMLGELMGGENSDPLFSADEEPQNSANEEPLQKEEAETAGVLPANKDEEESSVGENSDTDSNPAPQEESSANITEEDMINFFSNPDDTSSEADAPMSDDIMDLINSINADQADDSSAEQGNAIGDVFSDTLSVVKSLSDDEPAEAQESKKERKKREKEQKKEQKKAAKATKKGFFSRVFGNVKKERSEEEIAKQKEKIISEAQQKENAEEAKKQKAAAAKAEKKKKDAENKAAAVKKKQESAKKKAEAAKLKKDAKERKKQELQKRLDAVEQDNSRINRVGAAIVFIFFAIVAGIILIGTKHYSYSANIANAEKHFENDHYNEAYEYVAGLDIKEEDEEFYMRVMTVMYTYKQLNAYKNYYAAKLYPEALDSLLKGLQRYDKYSSIAVVLNIADDLDAIRGEILTDLKEVYGLSEKEAMAIMAIESQEDYTARVYKAASKAKPYAK